MGESDQLVLRLAPAREAGATAAQRDEVSQRGGKRARKAAGKRKPAKPARGEAETRAPRSGARSEPKASEAHKVDRSDRSAPRRSAAELAKQARDISVSEFFAKNRHLLGFDNPSKALLTTVKEGVDNSLDACEEAGILPDVRV